MEELKLLIKKIAKLKMKNKLKLIFLMKLNYRKLNKKIKNKINFRILKTKYISNF